jgi:hypothetical protein
MQRVISKIPAATNRKGGLTTYGIFAERAYPILKARDLTKTSSPKNITTAVRRFATGKTNAYEDHLDVYEIVCAMYEEEFAQTAKTRVIPAGEAVTRSFVADSEGRVPSDAEVVAIAAEMDAHGRMLENVSAVPDVQADVIHLPNHDSAAGGRSDAPGGLPEGVYVSSGAWPVRPAFVDEMVFGANPQQPDDELGALAQVIRALEPLDAPAMCRVLDYVADRFGLDVAS